MNAAPARFTFDLDFGTGEDRRHGLSDDAVAALTRQARADGYADGLADGEKSAMAQSAEALTQAVETLADRAAGAAALYEDAQSRHRIDAVGLAASIARKLAAHLIARQPAAEIEALLADCLASLRDAPHLLVRCHPQVADAVRAGAEARMALTGFSGRLMVMADPALGLSDGRIEWADGGVVRDMAAVSAEIDAAITAFLAASAQSGDAA